MIGYVYYLTKSTEDVPFYVGSTINPKQRLIAHKSKYSDFELVIVDEVSVSDRLELFNVEVLWIQLFLQWGFHLKNKFAYWDKEFKYSQGKGICAIKLNNIPKDVENIINEVQIEMKEKLGVLQFSKEKAVYEILRRDLLLNY